MQVIFCTSNKLGAAGIRLATWSDWSHVGIVDGHAVIEAVHPAVRLEALCDVVASHDRYAFVDIPVPNEAAALRAAYSQIDKPYDLFGMLGLALHRDWQEDDAWWSSELVAWVAAQGGRRLFRDGVLHRITPQHLWMLDMGW